MSYSAFLEKVLIYLFQDKRLFDDDIAVMFDHERGEFGPVDEDQPRVGAFGVVAGVGAEARRSDEYAAGGLAPCSARRRPGCPDERRGGRLALGLDVDHIES